MRMRISRISSDTLKCVFEHDLDCEGEFTDKIFIGKIINDALIWIADHEGGVPIGIKKSQLIDTHYICIVSMKGVEWKNNNAICHGKYLANSIQYERISYKVEIWK